MKTVERLHEYKDYIRTERKVEEYEFFEDLLLLSKLAEQMAKAAYAYTRCDEEKKAEAEALLSEAKEKLNVQIDIYKGYGGIAE